MPIGVLTQLIYSIHVCNDTAFSLASILPNLGIPQYLAKAVAQTIWLGWPFYGKYVTSNSKLTLLNKT